MRQPKSFIHRKLGQGIVLGKYSFTDGGKKEVKNYDEYEIDVSDKVYKDALDLAKASGLGYSVIDFSKDFSKDKVIE